MDSAFLGYYERELKHVRELSGEFARQYPKIASRLGLDSFACADPYVERLIEAFAFMSARVQRKLRAAQDEQAEHMLQLLYPDYLAATPSMAVMQWMPNMREGSLREGVVIPRGSSVRSALSAGQQTSCEYRTAHPVTLWPLSMVSAQYSTLPSQLVDMEGLGISGVKGALRLVLQTAHGLTFEQLPLDTLTLFLRGSEGIPGRLLEHLLCANLGLVVQSATRPKRRLSVVRKRVAHHVGFDDDQSLLPCGNRGFEGYRLLHEYFAFPERFLFVELRELRAQLAKADTDTVELVLLFDRPQPSLEGTLDADSFALHCSPAINLFPYTCDRVQLDPGDHEHHVVPDRMRPLDFEVHSVRSVTAYGESADSLGEVHPLYAPSRPEGRSMGYTLRRKHRPLPQTQLDREQDPHTPYVPSEAYLSLVDGEDGAFRPEMRQLRVEAFCTNRALPLRLKKRRGYVELEDHSGAPVTSVRCVAGPTPPRTAAVVGDAAWGLISHLSLDFLTLATRAGAGASALRQLLQLYSSLCSVEHRAQLAGVVGVETRGVVRPLPFPGPIAFGRGLEVNVTCDESAFTGSGVFLLGAVLARFFTKYASINSFTETVLTTQQRGEVTRWPIAPGRRSTL